MIKLDTIKKFLTNFYKYLKLFFYMICIFLTALFLASCFPSQLIEKNVKESSLAIYQEGNLYQLPLGPKVYNNNYTDSIMINMAYSINYKEPYYSFMTARKNFKEGQTNYSVPDTDEESITILSGDRVTMYQEYNSTQELYDFISGNVHISAEYARYWHGYLVFLRPMLIFFNVREIRAILLFVMILLLIIFNFLITKRVGWQYAIIFTYAFFYYDILQVSYSLESCPIFIVMMISSIILLKRIENIKDMYIYFFVVGCISNFVDFLTVPLVSLVIPMIIYIIYNQKNKKMSNKEIIIFILQASLIWFVGYSITWLSKWILFDITLNRSIVKNAIGHVLFRTSRKNLQVPTSLTDAYINFYKPYLIVLLILAVEFIIMKPKKSAIIGVVPYVILFFYPIMWYFVLANHTMQHQHFVYRHALISLVSSLVIIYLIQKQEIKS